MNYTNLTEPGSKHPGVNRKSINLEHADPSLLLIKGVYKRVKSSQRKEAQSHVPLFPVYK